MDKKTTTFKLNSVRYFSDDFKKKRVEEIVSKKTTIREVSILYEVSTRSVYNWINKYSPEHKNTRVVVEMESEAQKTLFYKERVAELERLIGQKQIEVEFLNKLIEIASEELQIDLKKSFSTTLLSGSGNTSKKCISQ